MLFNALSESVQRQYWNRLIEWLSHSIKAVYSAIQMLFFFSNKLYDVDKSLYMIAILTPSLV